MRKDWDAGIEEVHLFDFDGTITKTDSMFSFLRFHCGAFTFYSGMLYLAPFLLLGLLKGKSRKDLKERMLLYFLKNCQKEELFHSAYLHFQKKGSSLIRPAALSHIRSIDREKAAVVIVTASLEIWVAPFADFLNAELIATKPLFAQDNKFLGIDGANCSHEEKVLALSERYNWRSFAGKRIAYGNSGGDSAMYDFADEFFHCKFS